jgi:hypothetical protein
LGDNFGRACVNDIPIGSLSVSQQISQNLEESLARFDSNDCIEYL